MFRLSQHITKKGFTLAELLVVCALIAVLACTIIPVILRAREKSRLELCTQRIKHLGEAAVEFETAGVTPRDETYFEGLASRKAVLPWRTLRAVQLREDLPVEWADPLCVRKLTFFVQEKDAYTPIAASEGLGLLFQRGRRHLQSSGPASSYITKPEAFYCPSSTVWTAETGWGTAPADGSSYITYCSREGGFKSPDGRVLFNLYSTREMNAFLSCASFMGYQGHPNGWNVWFTDGHVRFIADQQGVLRDLKAAEWFDVPKDYLPEQRWSIWVHFDKLYKYLD